MKTILAAYTAALCVVTCTGTALAGDLKYPTQVFDAMYTTTGPGGAGSMHSVCDGKGHLRTESVASGQKTVSIMDFPAKTAYALISQTKQVFKMPLTEGQGDDKEQMKKLGAKSLGNKVVLGHPCHGWEYTSGTTKTTVWQGDDIKYLVKSETVSPQAKVTMELTSFTNKAPAADAFKIPADYKMP